MAEKEIHVNDIATRIRITIKDNGEPVDLSTSDPIIVRVSTPSGRIKDFEPVFTTNGSDGKIEYTTIDGDIDEVGIWKIQVIVSIGASRFHSDIGSFKVYS